MNEKEKSLFTSMTFDTALSLHIDEPVTAMSISPSGRDVVLGSRLGLYIVDLDDPFSLPRWLPHQTSWEVADVQWSPHASKYTWVISTSNQKAMVWNLSLPEGRQIEHILHSHTRAITDINFHPSDPEVLATCGVDSWVNYWDMRAPMRPAGSFCDWRAGATQVKWNRANPNVLASSHDNYVHIWDNRHGAKPLKTITAHSTKIYGLDFDRLSEGNLITCSLDRTFKVWDYTTTEASTEPLQPTMSVTADYPIWRARHTPFGRGCLVLPQRGGSNTLTLTDLCKEPKQGNIENFAVKKFSGHTDHVLEFLWRARGRSEDIDDREYQLITWSKDHNLRLWPMKPEDLAAVHHIPNRPYKRKNTRRGTPYVSFRDPQNQDLVEKKIYGRTMTRYSLGRNRIHGQTSHLNWLAGVRLGKAALSEGNPMIDTFQEPTLFSSQEIVPENLGEEISLVGHKFPNVRFEKIHVSTGYIVVSLYGPWGRKDPEIVFLRLEIQFPPGYPASGKIPEFSIERSSEISPQMIRETEKNIQHVAQMYMATEHYCLEGTLRYLLGDLRIADIERILNRPKIISEEEIDHLELTETKDSYESQRGHSKMMNPYAVRDRSTSDTSSSKSSSFSSDSELDEGDRDATLEEGQPPTVAQPLLNYNVPVPKACGALWSNDGGLVCFLPSKSQGKTLGLANFKKGKFKRKFQGLNALGRRNWSKDKTGTTDNSQSDIGNDNPAKPSTYQPISSQTDNAEDQGMSDAASDDSEYLEDEDPGSNIDLYNDMRFQNYKLKQSTVSSRSETLNTHDDSTAQHLRDRRLIGGSKKNYVCIVDFSDLTKLDKRLAAEYHILDSDANAVIAHNEAVARKYGYSSLGDIWHLTGLIQASGETPDIKGRMLWGEHPFGTILVDEILGYFDRQRDIQMLGMLACIFCEPAPTRNYTSDPAPAPEWYSEHSRREHSVASWENALYDSDNSGQKQFEKKQNSWTSFESERNGSSTSPNERGISSHRSTFLNRHTEEANARNSGTQVTIQTARNGECHGSSLASVPLLNPIYARHHSYYRSQYAEILYLWGLQVHRAEVLHFNSLVSLISPGYTNFTKNTEPQATDEHQGTVTQMLCSNAYYPGPRCDYCGLIVRGMFSACLVCQHVQHAHCASSWWKAGNRSCPSGCGCDCMDGR
ncbi:hypothetical protein CANCADRAFT_51841 [Tortispora caseinolytica NRRL Y-17796]|uniref:RWD domain-containing protein n=1 Tax=Tortispora caseinolytica NRRL Y-17796 TaxID=767744 RepID=A0A1E4THB4_9ASCO|nr:hypothetical protein CANCADRAFT_51841 [Tortispora caseinolytica NRRL Y-17796]